MEAPHNHRRLLGWMTFAVLLLLVAAIGDMVVGRQTLAPVLQSKPEPHTMYYEGTGFSIGNWRLYEGRKQAEVVGFGILITEGGNKLPIAYTRGWREDGTLEVDVEAFDKAGNAFPLYSPDLTEGQLMALPPLPLIIDRQYAPDGTVTAENRVVEGRFP
jgi:hypothetical protein